VVVAEVHPDKEEEVVHPLQLQDSQELRRDRLQQHNSRIRRVHSVQLGNCLIVDDEAGGKLPSEVPYQIIFSYQPIYNRAKNGICPKMHHHMKLTATPTTKSSLARRTLKI
jgi:hypothetical protein